MSHNLIICIEVQEPRHFCPFLHAAIQSDFPNEMYMGLHYFVGLNDTFHHVRMVDAKSLLFIVCISSMNLKGCLYHVIHILFISQKRKLRARKRKWCAGVQHIVDGKSQQ